MLRQIQAVSLIVLIIGLSIHFAPASAPGFGATCINRHDASFKSVLVHGIAVNYTGDGDSVVASSLWGYSVTIFFAIAPQLWQNPSGDLFNGSIFFADTIFGVTHAACYYNVPWVSGLYVMQFKVSNLTGYTNGLQSVWLTTGTHSGQYNITWLG